MIYKEKLIMLKNAQRAVFRSPLSTDAREMIKFLKTTSAETNFMIRYPEECLDTEEAIKQEECYLDNILKSQNDIMIVCLVNGEIAGNCRLFFRNHIKIRHRASVAIALLSKYWQLGIGTAMFDEMIEIAGNNGITQLELDYIEGNIRAKGLYEKVGFIEIATRQDAIRLKDGTMLKEISMIKKL